ncbi:hypothetical protein DPMN_021288 [Dreissena polymorpha]|uniref:Uncharacterized protein n=1 Tax=Dreissena polymorpha TaxID=45954 RepID=A0A9D4SAX1_DREPO|nr:hypothetical protein DPMN_021288 [Dreissena polymorpha]
MFRNQLSEVPELLPTTDQAIFLDGNHFHSLSALRAVQGFTNISARELYMNRSPSLSCRKTC